MKNIKPVIAIIDDDPFIVKILYQVLGEMEFTVITINENDDIEAAVDKNNVNLVLLDLNLKNHYGFEIARQLRHKPDLGLIMLTGSEDQLDKLVGLEIGLDDYIVKPFDNRELKARCRNVIRRLTTSKNDQIEKQSNNDKQNIQNEIYLNGLVLDKDHFKLRTPDGNELKLTNYEFKLLELFFHAEGEAINREAISQDIYNREWSPLTRSVDVLISKLRKKLNTFDGGISIITVRGEGYKLVK